MSGVDLDRVAERAVADGADGLGECWAAASAALEHARFATDEREARFEPLFGHLSASALCSCSDLRSVTAASQRVRRLAEGGNFRGKTAACFL